MDGVGRLLNILFKPLQRIGTLKVINDVVFINICMKDKGGEGKEENEIHSFRCF